MSLSSPALRIESRVSSSQRANPNASLASTYGANKARRRRQRYGDFVHQQRHARAHPAEQAAVVAVLDKPLGMADLTSLNRRLIGAGLY